MGAEELVNKMQTNQRINKSTVTNMLYAIWRKRFIYCLLLPATVLVIIFSYLPLGGLKMAFQDYNVFNPSASTFIGLENFKEIFRMKDGTAAIVTTLKISLLSTGICFPLTIIFALMLNEIRNTYFKKVIQTVSYLPHFLSWISIIGIVATLYSSEGIINDILAKIIGSSYERKNLMAVQGFFIPDVIILSTWKSIGWNSIVFLAAITGIDQSLYEAARVDGAGKFRQAWHITLPGIMPTIVIMFLWRVAALFGDDFELIYGLQNPFVNVETIGTVIYKNGIAGGNYQVSTAFGLMQGLVNVTFLIIANTFSKKITEVGIF